MSFESFLKKHAADLDAAHFILRELLAIAPIDPQVKSVVNDKLAHLETAVSNISKAVGEVKKVVKRPTTKISPPIVTNKAK